MKSPRTILPLLLQHVEVLSAIDVGCHHGPWTRTLLDKGVNAWGVDVWDWDPGELMFPKKRLILHDLKKPWENNVRYDLVLSLEVGEHIEPEHVNTYLDTLCKLGDLVLFSAALPGQGGDYHVNEQWLEFWIERFARRGYGWCDPFRSKIWNDHNVQWWYRQNIVLFANADACKRSPWVAQQVRDWNDYQFVSLVHPECYKRWMK